MILPRYKCLLGLIISTSLLSLSSQSSATQITYEASLTDNISVIGTVGNNGWDYDVAADVDFWSFSGVEGQRYQIQANRIDAGLDTAFTLYEGLIVAEESEFDHLDSFGNVTYLDDADDEIDFSGGPFGDPLLEFTANSTGFFSIAIGDYEGNRTGPYSYSLELTTVNAVPIPAAVWLFSTALTGLLITRRKHSKV